MCDTKVMSDGRSRNWCFTWNNPFPDEHVEMFQKDLEDSAKYYVMGYETAPSTGTIHIQGYIDFHNAKRITGLKKKYPKQIHWEKRKGTWAQAVEYCKKDGNFTEWGEPNRPGKRTDIDNVKKMVKDGRGMAEIIEVATSYQACKFAELAMKYKKPTMKYERKNVYWYFGPTGTGKTRTAMEMAGEDVWLSAAGGLRWFDGYDGQENVVIDDFRASNSPFSQLLKILDGYPVQVEIKGGFRWWNPKNIWITCPTHWRETYKLENSTDKEGQLEQLGRRITVCKQFGDEAPFIE